MKRTVFILFLILLFTACSTQTSDNDEGEEAVSTESNTVVETPTEAPVEEAVSEDTAVENEVEVESEPEQEVIQIEPVLPETVSIVRDDDWVKGVENGRIVIIEYGDFQ
ncbi:MAG: hypothetical protein AAF490_22865 [Chloroflexota bacterium]